MIRLLVTVSGWIAAALVWLHDDREIERARVAAYAEGLADGEDGEAQAAGA